MSNPVKKCPKDGIVYDAAFGGTCESCFGPLQFFCKIHNQWLVDETCNLCPKPARRPAPAPVPTEPKGYWFGLAMVAVLAVLVGSGLIIWRVLAPRQKVQPVATPVSAPVPPPPAPVATPKNTQPPIALSLKQILDDPEPYLGKFVTTPGSVQFLDTTKETFDLRHGDYLLQVRYHSTLVPSQEVTVTGVLRRDRDTLFISAQQIEKR